MAGMPILHETDVDGNMDAHKLVVMAANGATSGNLLDTQKMYEGTVERACEHREAGGGGAHPAAGGQRSESGNCLWEMVGRRERDARGAQMRSGADWLQHR